MQKKSNAANSINIAPFWVFLTVSFFLFFAVQELIDFKNGNVKLEVDPSIRTLLPDEGVEYERFESVRERYSSDDLLLVTWLDEDLFTPSRLEALKRLTKFIERIPGVVDVESPVTATQVVVYEDYSEVRGYLSEIPQTKEETLAVRDALVKDPLYSGYLVSANGQGVMLAVRLRESLSSKRMIQIVADIADASKVEAGNIEQFLSGPLFVRLEISRLLMRDLGIVMPLAVLTTLIVVAVGFRSIRGTLLPFISNFVALIFTLALFVHAGHTLNYVLVILPPTIYVVGFAYAIHVVSDFEYRFASGLDQRVAVRGAFEDVVRPLTLTALTTSIGFLSLTLSDIASIKIFGFYAAIGTILAWLSALFVVPAGLLMLPASRPAGSSNKFSMVGRRLAHEALSRRRVYLWSGLLLILVSLAGIARIEVSTDYLDNFPSQSDLRKNFEKLNEVFSGAVPLQVVLESKENDAFKSPESLRALQELKLWLLDQPEVGGVYTLLDYVGVLEQALAPEMIDDDPVPESSGLTSHLILLGGTEDVYRFAEPDFSSSLLQVRVRAVASSELNELTNRIEIRLAKLSGGLSGYVTGSSHVIADTLDEVTRGQVSSLLAALIPIYLVLVGLFRSFRLGALALVPNVLPILTFFGVLGFSGVTLNLTTSLVACVVLGIAVDDSIHFFARLRALVRKCDSAEEALEKTLIAVVRPVTFTTVGLTLGFLTLLVGELRSQVEFGLLAGFTLIVAWLLDLTFTPALAEQYGVAQPVRK